MTGALGHLRIVHLDTGEELRGGQHQLLLLARGLRERAHRQYIVCPEGSELESRAGLEEFQVVTLPAHDPWHANGIVQLRQMLSSEGADILHAHDGKGQAISWLSSVGMKVRRVASRRVTFLPSRRLDYKIKYDRTCHGVIAVSQFVRDLIVQSGVREEKIEVIYDGIEFPTDLPGSEVRRESRARWGFNEKHFVIGHVGAFTREKGQDLAIKAMAQLRNRIPEIRLLLVGNGPLLEAKEFTMRLKEVREIVRIEKSLVNLSEFFASLDLFIMPSRSEGLGSAALQAMAHGLSLVATRVGGLPEIVEDGATGWLVEPGSAEDLAEGIAKAFSDATRRRAFGLRARERAQLFTSVIMVERTEAFYRRLLEH